MRSEALNHDVTRRLVAELSPNRDHAKRLQMANETLDGDRVELSPFELAVVDVALDDSDANVADTKPPATKPVSEAPDSVTLGSKRLPRVAEFLALLCERIEIRAE